MSDAAPASQSAPQPEPQYATVEQQAEAASFGMWVFLATEVLFFGGMLLAYTWLRANHPDGVAEAGRHTTVVIGSVNTLVLLTSSFTMAWAVHAAEHGRQKALTRLLSATALLGLLFLGLKGYEYHGEWTEHLVPGLNFHQDGPHARTIELFYFLYFLLTGLHGIHVTIGIVLIALLAVRARRGAFSARYYTPVEVTGLYWHFVDIVWIFLYPLIYLVGRSGP
ncbi:cytochrome c oxidase subunit 3 family protein [Azospirillum melinis]|uniref:Cytochrome c oxidase subunit 3 family protein n=1 Tax=Azospirillum melinis TaxID=328839 RepID=A0ABX2K8Y3_9PROT|nr:cytochrome c oxidase subunit 3 family protein [Azospirillum melinis]MBP2306450.1 cytochrome c oxidase subunit 3 [Azospirillum melinis]NUA98192.1 cytochrome c oxidase subunit 3 family protein [Azospirillum melinis]